MSHRSLLRREPASSFQRAVNGTVQGTADGDLPDFGDDGHPGARQIRPRCRDDGPGRSARRIVR
ncbi:MAG: hypothetical protein M3021_05745 [Actinomycetota bacterium]|nr:hypothetical protein [Actinomycetota bacterium]